MPQDSEPGPWPVEIRVRRAERRLAIDFDDGQTFEIPAELLRVESPSAEVQGHAPAQKTTPAGKRDVGIVRLEQVGNYAVRVVFDDGHSSGIFTWPWLYRLGSEKETLLADYERRLEAGGLRRG